MRSIKVSRRMSLPAGHDPLLGDPVHWLPVPVARTDTHKWESLLCLGRFGIPAVYRVSLPAWRDGETIRRVMAEPITELPWPLRHLPFLDGDLSLAIGNDGTAELTWSGRWAEPSSGLSWPLYALGMYGPLVRAITRETLAVIGSRLEQPGNAELETALTRSA